VRLGVLLGEGAHANLPDANTPNRATM